MFCTFMKKICQLSSFFFLFVLVLPQPGCNKKEQPHIRDSASPGVTKIAVETAVVERKTLLNYQKVYGHIEPLYSVDIYSTVSGLVRQKLSRLGEQVKKGELLAEVIQDIPGMKFSPVKIKSTVEGTITAEFIQEGSRVTPERPLFTISRLQQIYFSANVPEDLLSRVHLDEYVVVHLQAYPGLRFQGKIKEISPGVDTRTGMGKVKVLIDNSNDRFRSGMYGWCNLITGFRNSLVVPLDAIQKRGDNYFLYVVEYGRVREVPLERVDVRGTEAAVSGEVVEGDLVVINPPDLIHDNSRVEVIR